MKIKVKPNEKCARPMRDILGMNNVSRITSSVVTEREIPRFDALRLAHIRFHDAPLDNPGQKLLDISRIFPLFHLDEEDERNYFFLQTDDYMRSIAHSDAEIDFRLGETIDHSGNQRLIGVPADIEKWARICRRIIGHYKNGEMHGMHLNIKRISVWEEPNNPKLFSGAVEQYTEMFCAVYRLVKKDFPDIKVGGPTVTKSGALFTDAFLSLCKMQGIVPDFVSSTAYPMSVEELHAYVDPHLAVMEKHGLSDTEFMLAELHYGVADWTRTAYAEENGFYNEKSASFITSALIELENMEKIAAAYYYSWATSVWSVMNLRQGASPLLPLYYGLLFFQSLAKDCERVRVETDASLPAKLLCGKTSDGRVRLLVSCHECEAQDIEIRIPCAAGALVKSIAADFSEAAATEGIYLKAEGGAVKLSHAGGCGVYLLEFDITL
ncbi:MAG: hypothetical protein J6J66_01190 [Clostridia bacterium]|nr:hypothetical protein [Clostridia bacterium]